MQRSDFRLRRYELYFSIICNMWKITAKNRSYYFYSWVTFISWPKVGQGLCSCRIFLCITICLNKTTLPTTVILNRSEGSFKILRRFAPQNDKRGKFLTYETLCHKHISSLSETKTYRFYEVKISCKRSLHIDKKHKIFDMFLAEPDMCYALDMPTARYVPSEREFGFFRQTAKRQEQAPALRNLVP